MLDTQGINRDHVVMSWIAFVGAWTVVVGLRRIPVRRRLPGS